MKANLICIHGNPGQPENFSEILKLEAFTNSNPIFFGAEEVTTLTLEEQFEELEEIVKAFDTPCDFLCYSWGSFLCLKFLLERGLRARRVIMINPTLSVKDGVSGILTILSQTPLINKLLFGVLAKSLAQDFVKKSFAPHSADPALSKKLTDKLQSAGVWCDAIVRKNEMAANPLEELSEIAEKILVIFGSDDQSVPFSSQRHVVQELQKYNHLEICEIKGAGHSLLWTHQDDVHKIITKFRGQNDGKSCS